MQPSIVSRVAALLQPKIPCQIRAICMCHYAKNPHIPSEYYAFMLIVFNHPKASEQFTNVSNCVRVLPRSFCVASTLHPRCVHTVLRPHSFSSHRLASARAHSLMIPCSLLLVSLCRRLHWQTQDRSKSLAQHRSILCLFLLLSFI